MKSTAHFNSTTLLGILLVLQPAIELPNITSSLAAIHEQSRAVQKGKTTSSTTANTEQALLTQVSARLLAVARVHPTNVQWPPAIKLVNEGDLNAYAILQADELGNGNWKERVDKSGKFIPYVAVDKLMMEEVIQSKPDRLAMLIAHELSHIILGHVLPTNITRRARTGTLRTLYTSEQEHDADLNGMKLVLAAGYDFRVACEVWEIFNSDAFTTKHPEFQYSSFEAAGADHPSWTDRLAYVDREKANLWRAMSAFENGSTFLQIQQYPAAQEAFSRVVTEFPDSYEGWANLGYSLLMMYLDAFDSADLKRFEIGQLVVGSFYLRPEELRARTRGVDPRMWQEAVDALKKALELKPDLSLAKANLGVAYLLRPEGKDTKTAVHLLEQAVASLKSDNNVYRYNVGAVMINAAVAALADGQVSMARERLIGARSLLDGDLSLSGAIDYNLALIAMRHDASALGEQRKAAASLFSKFLKGTSPGSVWWDLGYEKYVQLMVDEGLTPEVKRTLTAGSRVRMRRLPAVEIAPGVLVALSDRTELVKGRVKPLTALPAGTGIELLHHPPSGTDLLAGRRVVAIYLRGPDGPSLKIQALGTGARPSPLGIGMEKREVERLIGTDYLLAPLNDPNVSYHFYPGLGLGVRYDRRLKVNELVLAQITIARS